MDNLRVLWLDDGECILFNSLEKKTSSRSPAFVGKVAERVLAGEELSSAIVSENVDESMRLRTEQIIQYIEGTTKVGKFPIGKNEHKFYRTLVLCPTATCNLRCIYCSGNAGKKSSDMMDWTLAKSAIDFFFTHSYEYGPCTLQFHGAGEPMANPEIVKKSIEYARQMAAKRGQILLTRISTNGVFSDKTAKWVAENFNHVSLSLDGPPDIHDRQRPKINNKGSYDTVVRTMRQLEQKGVLKRINTVITPYGIDRMEEILRHIHSLSNVKEVRLLAMEYCGRCEQTYIPELDTKKFEEEFQKVLPVARSLNIEMLSMLEQVDYYTEYFCGACGFNMCTAPNGNISTCVEVMDEQDGGASELIIGQFDRKQEKIIIDWDKVSKLRNRTYHTLTGCTECTFRTNCSGNCLVRAGRKNGTVMSVDADACEMLKNTLRKYFIEMADCNTSGSGIPVVNCDNKSPGAGVKDDSRPEEIMKQKDTSFQEMIELSKDIIHRFDEIEQRPWTIEVTMIELMKQVGDLSRHLMMYEKYYLSDRSHHPNYITSREAIANELADILHCLIRISEHYHIDLEAAHIKARNDEIGYIWSIKNSGYIKK